MFAIFYTKLITKRIVYYDYFKYCKNPGINLKGSQNKNILLDYYTILIVMMYYIYTVCLYNIYRY